jgi:ubiquinol-cytochrome c reductase cytochrome c1 subunit
MNKLATFSAAVLFAAAGVAAASGGADLRLEPAPIHRLDAESLQRGARNYVNYCQTCHGLKYLRYERLTVFGLTEQQIQDNLIMGGQRISAPMTSPMSTSDARNWLGAVPPDLSLQARIRGTDWLYNYLLSFYRDEKTPTGWNNLVFPQVAMPHVLWQMSGPTRLVTTTFDNHERAIAAQIAIKGLSKLEPIEGGKWRVITVAADPDAPGTLTPVQYQVFVADLVNFLDFAAEPIKNKRISLGFMVLLYLGVLFTLVYLLKRSIWKKVH